MFTINHLIIIPNKPKPVPNPVLASGLHSALNREIKVKSRSGNLRSEKSELEKVFFNRKVKSTQKEIPDERTPIETELGQRLLGKKNIFFLHNFTKKLRAKKSTRYHGSGE